MCSYKGSLSDTKALYNWVLESLPDITRELASAMEMQTFLLMSEGEAEGQKVGKVREGQGAAASLHGEIACMRHC